MQTKLSQIEFTGVIPEACPSSKPLKLDKSSIDIAAGCDHNLMVLEDGSLVGFGFNSDYRLGTGDEAPVFPGDVRVIISGAELKVNIFEL